MKEIRLHGRGGQGIVKSAEVIVYAAVQEGKFVACFPYFGFEKKGGPVSAFVRIDDQKIREKNQVYFPHCLIVLDPTIMGATDVFQGAREDCVLVINAKSVDSLDIPDRITTIAYIDATALSEELLGRKVPNTVMLGAYAKATGWTDVEKLAGRAGEIWGEKNKDAVLRGYSGVTVIKRGESAS